MRDYTAILDFWLEGANDQVLIKKKNPPFSRWFASNRRFDEKIRELFEDDWNKAYDGQYREWEKTARGRLALIILFDQFSRNMYRNTVKMYASDPKALALSQEMVRDTMDEDLSLIERKFVYLPFMHAEDIEVQEFSVACFTGLMELVKKVNPANLSYYEANLNYAKNHCETVKRFQRFPHRNKVLNRVSTPEELAFLSA